MKIPLVWAKLFHVGGETGMFIDLMKLVVACRNFANAPKNRSFLKYCCSHKYPLLEH